MTKQVHTKDVEDSQSKLSDQEHALAVNDDLDLASEILFVVVLYKTQLTDSLTFKSLKIAVQTFLPHCQVDLLICDNSPTPQFDISKITDNICFNLFYLHDSANPGISKSYNRAAELASIKNKRWMLVLDQDTKFPDNGLREYIRALKIWPSFPIYTPQVYYGDVLLSPCQYYMHRGTPFAKINSGIHTLKNKNVINSGLLISIDAYQKVGGYDEKVWLYFSDFVFFDRLKKLFSNFVVLDCSLDHELSSSDYSNFSFAVNRFTYYCEGAKAASISSGELKAYLGYGVTVGLRSLKMCYRFRNVSFLKNIR